MSSTNGCSGSGVGAATTIGLVESRPLGASEGRDDAPLALDRRDREHALARGLLAVGAHPPRCARSPRRP